MTLSSLKIDKPVALGFQIELEFGNVGCGEGKTGVPGEKPLGARTRTNNKLNPHLIGTLLNFLFYSSGYIH